MSCRYDRETDEYLLPDGSACCTDDYGDPTKHCTAKRSCSQHIGRDELTCARCIGRTRTDLRQIVTLAALMLPEAVARGSVNTEVANLAGPSADPLVESWRRINHARATGSTIGDGTEETDPTAVLGIWQAMLSEDYGHDLPDRITLGTASAYLERNLHVIAQDPEQDFRLLARELRSCRSHLEAALRNDHARERGAPCPDCTSPTTGVGPRLVRVYAHWCEDEDCERMHYVDDSADQWVCPRDREHHWDHEDYVRWVETRRAV